MNATEYLRGALEIRLAQEIPPKLSYAGIEELINALTIRTVANRLTFVVSEILRWMKKIKRNCAK